MTRLGVLLALLGAIFAGCEAVGAPAPRSASPVAPAEPTVGIATLELPVVSGSRGRIAGYFPEQPLAATRSGFSERSQRFTYVIDFEVVEVVRVQRVRYDERTLPVRAEGVRRTYFHPGGTRITFADLSRFVAGEPVATDRVTFTFDFTPDFGQVVLRMRLHRTSARTLDDAGHEVRPPGPADNSFALFGRFSARYRGYLLTAAGV